LSTQPLEPGDNPLSPEQAEKSKGMIGAWQRILRWARQHGTKVAFGTDLLFSPEQTPLAERHADPAGRDLQHDEGSKDRYMGQLFALSGARNPYEDAKLGEGAWADMLLVNGDPTQDINVLKDYERNFAVIIKDGKIYKNLLD
jgi:hypothetical protein